MTALVVLALLFVASHLLLSSLPMRGRLVAWLHGETFYKALYSTVALATFAGMAFAYSRAPFVELWPVPSWLRALPLAAMPFAFWLVVEGLTRPNPAAVDQGAKCAEVTEAVGAFAITRHPFMWGFALWAAAHILANGDAASLVMMGAVLTLALGGTLHMEHRRRATQGEAWAAYAKQSSWLPFRAMAQGRARLRLRHLSWWRPLLALALFAGFLHGHRWLFGVSPLP